MITIQEAEDDLLTWVQPRPFTRSYELRSNGHVLSRLQWGKPPGSPAVDYQPVASSGGENYGWRLMEGPACFNPPVDCNDGTLTLPIIAYPHEGGGCAVIGGYRYRGTLVPEAFGRYFFADHCTGQIWTATPRQGGRWRVREFKDTDLFINAFGEDEAGELCLAHYVPIGTIYCLLPAQ